MKMISEISTEVEKAIKNVEDSRLYTMVQGVLGVMGPAGDIVGKIFWVLSLFAVYEKDVWTQLKRNMTLKVEMSNACILSIFIEFQIVSASIDGTSSSERDQERKVSSDGLIHQIIQGRSRRSNHFTMICNFFESFGLFASQLTLLKVFQNIE
jgi:hypothetical protein